MPMKTALAGTSSADIAVATSTRRCRAASCSRTYSSSEAGVKEFSKPFGVTTSTERSRNWAHSLAVISLTVVNTSASRAAIFSREWRATTPKRWAISSPLKYGMSS